MTRDLWYILRSKPDFKKIVYLACDKKLKSQMEAFIVFAALEHNLAVPKTDYLHFAKLERSRLEGQLSPMPLNAHDQKYRLECSLQNMKRALCVS